MSTLENIDNYILTVSYVFRQKMFYVHHLVDEVSDFRYGKKSRSYFSKLEKYMALSLSS